jgi:hypothetical protein
MARFRHSASIPNARGRRRPFRGRLHADRREQFRGLDPGRRGRPMRLGFPFTSIGRRISTGKGQIIRLAEHGATPRKRSSGQTGHGSIGEGQTKPHPQAHAGDSANWPCRSDQGKPQPTNPRRVPDSGEAQDGRHCPIPRDFLL